MDLLLTNLQWADGTEKIHGDLRIRKGVISDTGSILPTRNDQTLDFRDHYAYPGFTNSHDHLEMNLYPRMGSPPYGNYTEWGKDIYRPTESPVREIQKVDIADRLIWGGVKNMVSGVTTVAHHNPWQSLLGKKKFPVHVLDQVAWSHSLAFGKNNKTDFPKKSGIPYVIHAAEGVDAFAFGEVNQLMELGLLKKNTVLVHAIALSKKDKDLLSRMGCSVVWCPSSNLFLFDKTADIRELIKIIPVALGSDSTMTGSATLLDEMQCAFQTGWITPRQIFDMVTSVPALIFNLPLPRISRGAVADLVIAPRLHEDYFENLLHLKPSNITGVFLNGKLVFADASVAAAQDLKFSFTLDGRGKKSTTDVKSLMTRMKQGVKIEILQRNPLWKMFGA